MNLKIYFFTILLNLCLSSAHAQRQFAVCDSTEYILNSDTSVIAGRNHLYTNTQSGINLIYDFSQPDTNYYIRDFDIIYPDLWYTLVGSRYIGYPTILYKSIDRGNQWQIDSSFYPVTRLIDSSYYYNSINQVFEIGTDTLLLFMSYYDSGIAYSTDSGNTWHNWFHNLITHYHGIFECDSLYYIFGFEGDAISPWMFAFERENLFRDDSLVNFNHFSGTGIHPPCYNGPHPDCIHSNSNLGSCGQYYFFKNYIDSICSPATSISEINSVINISVFPNPADQTITVTLPLIEIENWNVEIYNVEGHKCISRRIKSIEVLQKVLMNVESVPAGMYFIVVQSDKNRFIKKITIM